MKLEKRLVIFGTIICIYIVASYILSLAGLFQGVVALLCVLSMGMIMLAFFGICILPIRNLEHYFEKAKKEEELPEIIDSSGMIAYKESINALLEQYAEKKLQEHNAEIFDEHTELTALQSQINPHFLYNTLDSIRGQALMDDCDEIARMIEALSAFFRYSISRKGNLVTLRDELTNINNYMIIQRYRFNNRFSMEVLIDEEDEMAYDFLVPRLIVQPVVENAIFHGLEEKLEGGVVTIEILTTDESLIIIISDNGFGIEPEALKKLNDKIHSKDMKLRDTGNGEKRNTGIALPNIHKRIQLLFGERYGVNVYSTVGQGTDVEITIPADVKREDIKYEEGTASR